MKIIVPVIIVTAVAAVVVVILWARHTSPKKTDTSSKKTDTPQEKAGGISPRQAAWQIAFQEEMRKKILQGSLTEFGIDAKSIRKNVWGALMEWGFPEGAATVVCLCDGTTSLYMGRGGGIIGGQGHESVRAAGGKFLDLAGDNVHGMSKAETFPMPENGRARFYIMTSSGVFFADEDMRTLGEGKHQLSPLFHAGNDVISQLRQTMPGGAVPRAM